MNDSIYVRPDVSAFLDFINNQPGPRIHELTADDAREMVRLMGTMAELPAADIAVKRDISIPGPAGMIPARLYDIRADRAAGPVMIFFHGGGFVVGDIGTYDSYCAEAASQLDIPVISIDYRLAPEHPFPASSDDCEAAARWIAENSSELGFDATGLILSGDSAGGNLTIITTMALRDKPAALPVILQHPIYPAVSARQDWPSMQQFADGFLLSAEAMTWFFAAYQPAIEDYRGAPLEFDQKGMPPTLIITASLDPLLDQGLAYYQALKDAGVWATHRMAEGNIHGHINLRRAIPSSQEDIQGNFEQLKGMLAVLMADA